MKTKVNTRIDFVIADDGSRAIFIEPAPFGYRLKEAARGLSGQWCNSFHRLEGGNIFKTKTSAIIRAHELLSK